MDINQDSGQIEIESPYGSVFLYTHNQVQELIHIIYDVLSRMVRWDDPDYLTRMLFCRMVPPELWSAEDQFGIGTQMYADIKLLITLNIERKEITFTEFSHATSIYARGTKCTFEKFVNNFTDNALL